tara:strand:- start:257 stop:478 length:222 start_codon:yes stop_codon:yes gene_type:complete
LNEELTQTPDIAHHFLLDFDKRFIFLALMSLLIAFVNSGLNTPSAICTSYVLEGWANFFNIWLSRDIDLLRKK